LRFFITIFVTIYRSRLYVLWICIYFLKISKIWISKFEIQNLKLKFKIWNWKFKIWNSKYEIQNLQLKIEILNLKLKFKIWNWKSEIENLKFEIGNWNSKSEIKNWNSRSEIENLKFKIWNWNIHFFVIRSIFELLINSRNSSPTYILLKTFIKTQFQEPLLHQVNNTFRSITCLDITKRIKVRVSHWAIFCRKIWTNKKL